LTQNLPPISPQHLGSNGCYPPFYQWLYHLARTILHRRIHGAVLEGSDHSCPWCYGKVDRQNFERGAHRAEVHEGFRPKPDMAPGPQQAIPQMHGKGNDAWFRHFQAASRKTGAPIVACHTELDGT